MDFLELPEITGIGHFEPQSDSRNSMSLSYSSCGQSEFSLSSSHSYSHPILTMLERDWPVLGEPLAIVGDQGPLRIVGVQGPVTVRVKTLRDQKLRRKLYFLVETW